MRTSAAKVAAAATLSLLCALPPACREDAAEGEGAVIAELGTRRLYLGDAGGVVAPGSSAADSLAALRAFAERWVRDAAVAEAAAAEIGADEARVARLVADYRDRLLRLRYEDRLARTGVDTVVGDEELARLYDEERPLVDAPAGIARVILLTYGGEPPDVEAFLEDWAMLRRDTAAKARVLAHGEAYAELALADERRWRDVGAVAALAGGLDADRIRDGANVRREGTYLRVLDYAGPGEPAPLAYVRDRLRGIVVTRRRAAFLASERARLYDEARDRDAVKIYLPDE